MIAFASSESIDRPEPTWQAAFEAMLPKIKAKLRFEFRHLSSEAQQESVQAGTVNCLLAFRRLVSQGRAANATAGTLAMFAARQVRSGRTTAKLNRHDLLSDYGRQSRGVRVERLGRGQAECSSWLEELVQDRRICVPDQVALRIDLPQWLSRLPRRLRAIARDLSLGWSTAEVARRYRLSAARISQLRREFQRSWEQLQSRSESTSA